MPYTTIQVEGLVTLPTDEPASGYRLKFELRKADKDAALVLPHAEYYTVPEDGNISLPLWPNARGIAGTVYYVYLIPPGEPDPSQPLGTLSLPDLAGPVNLYDHFNVAPPPTLSDAQAAELSAQGYAATALGHAEAAEEALSDTLDAASYISQDRNALTATVAAGLSDGSVVMLAGLLYEVDSSATGAGSATNDLSVDGLRPFGRVFIEHFGETGTGDDTDVFNAAVAYLNNDTSSWGALLTCRGDFVLPNGVTTAIARNAFFVDQSGSTFTISSGALWTFGDRLGQYTAGGLMGGKVVGDTSDNTTCIAKVQGISGTTFENIDTDRIASLFKLGHDLTYRAYGVTINRLRGSTLDADGAIALDCAYGGGLMVSQVNVSCFTAAGSVPVWPTDRTTLSPQSNTIAVRFGVSSWDTFVFSDCLFGHYRWGLSIVTNTNIFVSNGKMTNVYFDYCADHGLRLSPNGGGINYLSFNSCWFASTDNHAVTIQGSGGGVRGIRFNSCEARQAGKRNWSFTCTVMSNVELIGCKGMGANRLSSNTGTDQDDLVVSAGGVKLIGGRFGEDGQPYTAIIGNQGRYGVVVSPNLPNVSMTGVDAEGSTAGWLLNAYTVAQSGVCVQGNMEYSGTRPGYATQGSLSAPTSGVQQTWAGPYDRVVHIFGGTVSQIRHRGFMVSDGSGHTSLHLCPGDTWQVNYTVAPTLAYTNLR